MGNPYEFRLNTDTETIPLMVVRCAGADGRFPGDVHEIGAFPPAETSEDIVWVDGYFARWPEDEPVTRRDLDRLA